MHCQAGNLLVSEQNFSAIRTNHTNDHIERGSFSCAIWPEETDDFPGIHVN